MGTQHNHLEGNVQKIDTDVGRLVSMFRKWESFRRCIRAMSGRTRIRDLLDSAVYQSTPPARYWFGKRKARRRAEGWP